MQLIHGIKTYVVYADVDDVGDAGDAGDADNDDVGYEDAEDDLREIARECSELVGRSDFSRLRSKIAQNLAIPLLHEGDLAGLKRPGLRSLEPKW